jgi:hypothetical protein
MRLTIDERVLAENNLTLDEFLILLFNSREADIKKNIESLVNKGWAERDLFEENRVVLSDNIRQKVADIVIDSEQLAQNNQDNFEALARKLMEVYPEGRKAGTTYYWRGSVSEVARKLKNLVVKYNCKFTEQQAIEATKAYVTSFNGDYKFMKLLKYFLLKAPKNNNGDIEIESEFMTYLENKDVIEAAGGDWTTDLV